MRYIVALALWVFLAGCGTSLSDEQRKAYREELEVKKAVRVTEIEITEMALREGRNTILSLDSLASDSAALAQYIADYPGRITYMTAEVTNADPLERQLWDAYKLAGPEAAEDNLQNVRDEDGVVDTLLYSKPVIQTDAGGNSEVIAVWNVWIPKKQIVLEITRTK